MTRNLCFKAYSILIIGLFFCPSLMKSQGVFFVQSADAAFDLARQRNKIVFVEFYSNTCHVCQAVNAILEDPAVGQIYNERFINYRIDIEGLMPGDKEFMESWPFKPSGTPLFLFFDLDKKIIHYASPPRDVNGLNTIANTALNPRERMSGFALKFQEGDRSVLLLNNYSKYLKMLGHDSSAAVIADVLFDNFPKNNLFSKLSFNILKNNINSIDNGFYKYWYDHRDSIAILEPSLGGGMEYDALKLVLDITLQSDASKSWSLDKIVEVKKQIAALKLSPDVDIYTWERESSLLIADNRIDDAMKLLKRLLYRSKPSVSGDVYIYEYFLNKFSTQEQYHKIGDLINTKLSSPRCTDGDRCYYLYLKAKYLSLVSDSSQAILLLNEAIPCALEFGIDNSNMVNLKMAIGSK